MNTQSRLLNAIFFQMMWFSAALLNDTLALAMVGVLVVHFIWMSHRFDALSTGKFFVILMAFLLGLVADFALKMAGVYTFTPNRDLLGDLPVWLVVMWLGFSFTLYASLEWLITKPIAFVFCCAVFGPLSYWVGMQVGIVRFMEDDIILISCVWIAWGSAIAFLHNALQRMGLIETTTVEWSEQ